MLLGLNALAKGRFSFIIFDGESLNASCSSHFACLQQLRVKCNLFDLYILFDKV